ncbi:MAG TPA: SAM-dependent methyltransferase [Polyangiales bacterium]|nr:SAM-dependent methyltransferase [Polyangiales bacterium]
MAVVVMRPNIYRPGPPLADFVDCFWHWDRYAAPAPKERALPSGTIDLIISLDDVSGPGIPIIEVRTRWFDEALLRADQNGARQFVILAAGMDARAYRLAWSAGVRLFEIDQPDVLASKERALASAAVRCGRRSVAIDLGDDWPRALEAAAFDRSEPTTWLIGGLLQYLDAPAVAQLFARIDALSSAGSRLLYDVVGQRLLEAPQLAHALRYMRELGAPWRFGSDEPLALLASPPWRGQVVDPAAIGNAWQRWPFPAQPLSIPQPRGYLIEANKA